MSFAVLLRRLRLLSLLPLLGLAPAGPPAPRPVLTGFTQVLAMSAAELKTQLTGSGSTVSGTALRVPIGANQNSWPTIDLGRAMSEPWQRLAAGREVLLEVSARGLRPGVDAGFSLVWSSMLPMRTQRLRFDMGRSVRWSLRSTHPDAEAQGWLPDEPPAAAGLPLHRIGWLLRRDTIWAVVDHRPVAAYPAPWDLTASTAHLDLEIDGGAGQTVEIAGVRLLSGPVHSAATRAAQVAVRTEASNQQAATRRAEAALTRPVARPAGLTLLAELQGESLRAELARLVSPFAGLQLAGEQVVLAGDAVWQSGGNIRLPESFKTAYLDRLRRQPLYLECRGQLLGANGAPPKGRFALYLSAAQGAGEVTLAWAPDQPEWHLRHGPATRTGPVPAAAAAAPHTLGLLLAGDSATVYFDDRPLPGKAFVGFLTQQPNPIMPLNLGIGLGPSQTLRLDYIRLSAQGEAEAVTARQAAAQAREAQARQAAQEHAARDVATRSSGNSGGTGSGSAGASIPSPTRTTPSGVQYSTADMSMFQKKPGAWSGYSTGAGAPKCARCNGFGKVNTRPNSCSYCGGTGGATARVPTRTWTERGPTGREYHYQSSETVEKFVACSHCLGGPAPNWITCATCNGSGK